MQSSNNSNDSLVSAESEMAMGIKLSSRPMTAISERNGRVEDHAVSDNVIQEPAWTLNNMLERFAFLDTYPWLSSQASHTVLAKLRVPQDLIKTSISSVPFESFVFWNGDVEVNFQVTSTPLVQGMLAAVFVPLSAKRFIDSTIVPNFTNVSLNQVVYLYANTNTSARMRISYNSPQAYIDLTEDAITTRNALGFLYLVVFNPVQLAATASDTSSVSVFTRFLNNKFKVPRVSANVTAFRARPQAMAMLGNAAVSALTQHRSPPTSGSKTALRTIANKLIPSGVVADVIDSALGIFGLDKPTDPNLSAPNQVIGTQRMNFVQGVETIDKMTLFPAQTYETTKETFATSMDEMDFEFLKKKYSYLGSFSFSTTSAIGSVIASWPINPVPSELFNGQITQVPLISYLSIPFQFWKGGLTFKVQVVSTSFQTGKIFFAFNFNTFTPPVALSLGQLTSQYGQAYELNQGSNEVEFSVPFVAATPVLDVPNSNIPTFEDTSGYINVVVLNPLVAPNNTPTSITLNVFIAGADDFELSTLTQANNVFPAQPEQLADEFEELHLPKKSIAWTARPQSAMEPLNTPVNGVDLAEENLVAPNTTTSPRTDTTQTSALSLRNLLKKYQSMPIKSYPLPTLVNNGFIGSIPISYLFETTAITPLPVIPGTVRGSWGLWSHFKSLYRQFKGPLRFKIMVNELTPNYQFAIFYQPPVNQANAVGTSQEDALANSLFIPEGIVAPSFNGRSSYTRVPNQIRLPITYVNALQKTAEFEIPFSSKFLSVLSWTGSASENELATSPLIDLGTLVFYAPHVPEEGIPEPYVHFFVALGDESRFGNLFQVPPLAVNSTVDIAGNTVASTWPDSYGTGAPVSNTLTRL